MVSAASLPWDRVSGTHCHVTFVYQSIAWNFSKINLKHTFFNCSSDTSASADHRHEWRYTKCSITLHYITLQYGPLRDATNNICNIWALPLIYDLKLFALEPLICVKFLLLISPKLNNFQFKTSLGRVHLEQFSKCIWLVFHSSQTPPHFISSSALVLSLKVCTRLHHFRNNFANFWEGCSPSSSRASSPPPRPFPCSCPGVRLLIQDSPSILGHFALLIWA